MRQLTLIGCNHNDTSRNYSRVMRILKDTHPSFVSQEIRLFYHLSKFWEPVLSASLEELDRIEKEILRDGSYTAEYEAGIIYCRRTNTPLHWTDLYYATLEEVVQTNVLDVNPSLLWADDRDIPTELLETDTESGQARYFDVSERNVFTGNALSNLLRKYSSGDGIHVCGKKHYALHIRTPLQAVLASCASKPYKIEFRPKFKA